METKAGSPISRSIFARCGRPQLLTGRFFALTAGNIEVRGLPHLAKNERDMGHPAFVAEKEVYLQTRVVGVSVPRKEGVPKLTGQARYIDDLSLPGMIFGATVRSTIARGAIETITF